MALEYFSQSAKHNIAEGFLWLGLLLLEDGNNQKSKELAAQYLQTAFNLFLPRADRAGDSVAMAYVGEMLSKGLGVECSMESALDYTLRAARGQHPSAMLRLAKFYELNGEIANSDRWAQAAFTRGQRDAMVAAAWLYERRGYVEAIKCWQEAAKYAQNQPIAWHMLGWHYERDSGTQESDQDALHYYKLAAKHGYAPALDAIGRAYRLGNLGLAPNMEKAYQHFVAAIDAGDDESYVNLGELYETGAGVEKCLERAHHYYQIAACKGIPFAYYRLGRCFALGIGCDQSIDEALEYLRKAADGGEEIAMDYLAKLLSVLGKHEEAVTWWQKICDLKSYEIDNLELKAIAFESLTYCFREGKGIKQSLGDAEESQRQSIAIRSELRGETKTAVSFGGASTSLYIDRFVPATNAASTIPLHMKVEMPSRSIQRAQKYFELASHRRSLGIPELSTTAFAQTSWKLEWAEIAPGSTKKANRQKQRRRLQSACHRLGKSLQAAYLALTSPRKQCIAKQITDRDFIQTCCGSKAHKEACNVVTLLGTNKYLLKVGLGSIQSDEKAI